MFLGEILPPLRAVGVSVLIWLGVRSHQPWLGQGGRICLLFLFKTFKQVEKAELFCTRTLLQPAKLNKKCTCLCWGLSVCLEAAMQQNLASPGVTVLSCVPPKSHPCPNVMLPTAVDGNPHLALSGERDWVLPNSGVFSPPWFWWKNWNQGA